MLPLSLNHPGNLADGVSGFSQIVKQTFRLMAYSPSYRFLHPAGHFAKGFTLLELLVVMALVGMLTGIIAPRLWQWIEGTQQRTRLDALRGVLQHLPEQAFFDAKARRPQHADLPIPEGWRVELPKALVYEPNGMTNGGHVRVWSGESLLADWLIAAPSGEIKETL